MNFKKLLAFKQTKTGQIWSALLLNTDTPRDELKKKARSLARSKPFRHAFGEQLTELIKTEITNK